MNKPPTVAPISPQELKAGRDVLLANAALWKIISARLSARTIDEIAEPVVEQHGHDLAGPAEISEQSKRMAVQEELRVEGRSMAIRL